MNKKVIKPLFLLSFAFCLAFLPPLTTFAEEDILGGSDEEILNNSNDEILNDCENAINVWSESKLRRYAEDNILYYDDQFKDSCNHTEKPESENPCGSVIIAGDNAGSIASSLRGAGFSDTSIAAILGNLAMENSSFNPRQFEIRKGEDSSPVTDDYRLFTNGVRDSRAAGPDGKGRGFGLAQWTTAGRQSALQDHADERNLSVASLEAQIGYLLQELSNPSYGSTPSILNNLSLEDAVFQVAIKFERPAKLIYDTHNGKYYNDYVPSSRSQLDQVKTPNAYEEYTNRENAAKKYLGTPTEEGTGDCSTPTPQDLKSGGMTLAEAQNWMAAYHDLAMNRHETPDAKKAYTSGNGTIYYVSGCYDTLNNCSAFSAWFVNNYTTASTMNLNGAKFAQLLLNSKQGFTGENGSSTEVGTSPALYAIFSTGDPTPGASKHTGVVLGIDTEHGKIIVGEASCHFYYEPRAKEYNLSKFLSGYTYAYTDNILKGL